MADDIYLPGDALRLARERSGHTMGDLARFLGVDVVLVSAIERGNVEALRAYLEPQEVERLAVLEHATAIGRWYVIEVQRGCWLAPWGKTTEKPAARRFGSSRSAMSALTHARRHEPLPTARIVAVNAPECS